MAIQNDNASTFRIVAIVTAVLLLAVAAFVYLQSAGGGGSAASGSAADWRQLDAQSSAVLAKRAGIKAVSAAAAELTSGAQSVLEGSNALLDRSGATTIIQEFQQRADRIRQAAAALPDGGSGAAAAIAADVAFLRDVINGLNGDASKLDIAPLNEAGREAAIVPMLEVVEGLEEQAAVLNAAFDEMGGLADAGVQLAATAEKLLAAGAGATGGGGLLPAPLNIVWVPIGLLGLAILLVLGLQMLHNKVSVFERMARETAEQNERNQQAILRLLDEMGSLADGDLTVEATVTEDITGTIADSFNFAIEELRKLVATVNETALMVDAATKQTENTAAHLARAAGHQAKEINAATESIVSMAGSIEEVSGNAERSSDVARHSVEVAHKGGEAVRRTIDGMNAIRETIQETSKRIKRLGESSQEIGNIVELINDIAEQTNILALNASIQASMAGEAGRGFAVVADEVQRLAERSTNATKQIEVLVRTIQSDTNEAVVSMERSTTDVVGGALLAENAGAALDEIEQVSNQIASLVQNISGSAREQAGAAADVTRRTTRLKEIGDQTGKATAVTAASIAKLSQLATELRKTVEGFTLPPEMMDASALKRTSSNVAPAPAAAPKPQAKVG
ncbi:MAG: methyl-accepting chemotaxis protein [Gammaproteobacteria bacterium]|nr:methyl-accepting chemotaxis protein [Gammaproteobacteria bacterium]